VFWEALPTPQTSFVTQKSKQNTSKHTSCRFSRELSKSPDADILSIIDHPPVGSQLRPNFAEFAIFFIFLFFPNPPCSPKTR
jgi:hypothetical protein